MNPSIFVSNDVITHNRPYSERAQLLIVSKWSNIIVTSDCGTVSNIGTVTTVGWSDVIVNGIAGRENRTPIKSHMGGINFHKMNLTWWWQWIYIIVNKLIFITTIIIILL